LRFFEFLPQGLFLHLILLDEIKVEFLTQSLVVFSMMKVELSSWRGRVT
jgi:hypothetical protein